jgi:hypothetical protein
MWGWWQRQGNVSAVQRTGKVRLSSVLGFYMLIFFQYLSNTNKQEYKSLKADPASVIELCSQPACHHRVSGVTQNLKEIVYWHFIVR